MRKCREPFTAEYLKTVLNYSPETGQFTWLKGCRQGKEAGSLNPNGYVSIGVKITAILGSGSVNVLAHRLAVLYMTGEWPKGVVDHVLGVRNDNRWAHLEDKTHSENLLGYRTQGDTVSGVRGVTWCVKGQCWQASHTARNAVHYLGLFDTIDEAEAALIASRNGKPKPVRKEYQYRVARRRKGKSVEINELIRENNLKTAISSKLAQEKLDAEIAYGLANHTLLPRRPRPQS